MAVTIPKEFVTRWREQSGEELQNASEKQYSTLLKLRAAHRQARNRPADPATSDADAVAE